MFQVGVAVRELDQMTQQSATLVEQTVAAASVLNDQAVGLAHEVDKGETTGSISRCAGGWARDTFHDKTAAIASSRPHTGRIMKSLGPAT